MEPLWTSTICEEAPCQMTLQSSVNGLAVCGAVQCSAVWCGTGISYTVHYVLPNRSMLFSYYIVLRYRISNAFLIKIDDTISATLIVTISLF